MSFLGNIEDAVLDNAADRVINNFLPSGNGLIDNTIRTGVDQFVNTEINREIGGGLGSGGATGNSGGFF